MKENKSYYALYGAPSTSSSRMATGHQLRRRQSVRGLKSDTEAKEVSQRNKTEKPQHVHRPGDPTVGSGPSGSAAETSVKIDPEHTEIPPEKCCKKCKRFIYDKEKKTILGRTCKGWLWIVLYSIMYLITIITYTLILVAITLLIIRKKTFREWHTEYMMAELKYSPCSVELTGFPLEEHSFPLIWYRSGVGSGYVKYIAALDAMVHNDRGKGNVRSSLGPCGEWPYGYGDKPCVLVKIDQQKHWVGKPLKVDSPRTKNAPMEVQKWIKSDSTKYWMHCAGNHNYDKEHLGKIVYYPDPPGFDSSLFPMDINSTSQVIAFQVTNFTLGISLTVECKLWFEDGFTSFAFMLYVLP